MQLGHSGVFVSRLTGKCKAEYKTHSTLVIVKLYKIWRICDETAFRGMKINDKCISCSQCKEQCDDKLFKAIARDENWQLFY